ncbi:MAG: Uma2 family endonuclease [Caldilineaceae bacterium]
MPNAIAVTENALPTFPWEAGYRLVTDPATGEQQAVPLTLFDILYPSEADIGTVFMAQGPLHDLWSRVLAVMLQAYLAASGWLILHDVFVRWGQAGVRPLAPDITAIRGGKMPPKGEKSYLVGRDGPLPEFVVEITSEETRSADLEAKKALYAALGIKEYLIIDLLPDTGDTWQLLGYRLANKPYYTELAPDAEGGLSFATVGLRFIVVEQRIEVYELATGQRLLNNEEANLRAEAEARARTELESKLRAMEAKLRQAGIEP